jgi:hypothetical protein
MLLRTLIVVVAAALLAACGGTPCGSGIPSPYIVYVAAGNIPPGTFDGGVDGGASNPPQSFCNAQCNQANGPNGVTCFSEAAAGSTAIQCDPVHPVCN